MTRSGGGRVAEGDAYRRETRIGGRRISGGGGDIGGRRVAEGGE